MYISNSNLKKILNTIEVDENSFDDLYQSDLNFCLSKAEKIFLKQSKIFFENKDRSVLLFKTVEPKADTLRFIFETDGSTPAYHTSADCQRLKSKWVNYYIPEVVQKKGKEEIEKFRKYVKNHINSGGELSDQAFLIELRANFGTDDRFGKVEADNSGTANFAEALKNETSQYVNLALDKIHAELIAFKNISEVHKKYCDWIYFEGNKIKKFAKNLDEENKAVALALAELKIKLMTALMESYIRESEFDQGSIEEDLLLALGFRKCNSCSKPNNSV